MGVSPMAVFGSENHGRDARDLFFKFLEFDFRLFFLSEF
jgi:hypothetical protein